MAPRTRKASAPGRPRAKAARPRRKAARGSAPADTPAADPAPSPLPPPPVPAPAPSPPAPPEDDSPAFEASEAGHRPLPGEEGPRRPLPRNFLVRPLPRRLPPIERDVDLKAVVSAIPPGALGGGRGERGRHRGRGRDRDRRRGRGNGGGPPPAASIPPAPSAPPPSAGAPPPAALPADASAPAPAPAHFAAPHPAAPGAPPFQGQGHGQGQGGGRRRRRRGRGRDRDRDRDRDAHRDQGRPFVQPSPPPPPSPPPLPAVASPAPPAPVVAAAPAPSPIGNAGEFPFTRGIHPTMYRGRPWTMRQYAGFSSAAETNRRFRYLLERGQTGLSIAFDLPTQIGYDSDDPRADGEVGKVGVPVNSLADMETVLDGIPLDRVTVSMTINATAPILVAMVAAVAKRRGIPLAAVGGTVQNDLLKEFVARNTWRFPVEPSLRLSTDLVRFCVAEMPKWNPVSVSGYHMREAGCTAAQEIAFTLGHGLAYLDLCVKSGLDAGTVAARMSFFFASQMDLLEEVAKFRAARRLWARLVRERFRGDDQACRLRFHTQTAGVALTSRQPEVNVVRVTLQALAAVLGGTQSLHTNSRDEALGLPTEESVLLALRTQQVLAEESGIAAAVDPLGGAPFVEQATDRLEAEARALLREMEAQGGPVEAARKGWTQARIAEAAWKHQKAVETGTTVVVGVNRYAEEGAAEAKPAVLRVDPQAQARVVEDLARRRAARDGRKVDDALFALELAAGWGPGPQGLVPAILAAVEAEATVGEICRSLEKCFGTFDPSRP